MGFQRLSFSLQFIALQRFSNLHKASAFKPVAPATHSDDAGWFGCILFDLLAQPAHKDIHQTMLWYQDNLVEIAVIEYRS
jgi:hypothetical protein